MALFFGFDFQEHVAKLTITRVAATGPAQATSAVRAGTNARRGGVSRDKGFPPEHPGVPAAGLCAVGWLSGAVHRQDPPEVNFTTCLKFSLLTSGCWLFQQPVTTNREIKASSSSDARTPSWLGARRRAPPQPNRSAGEPGIKSQSIQRRLSPIRGTGETTPSSAESCRNPRRAQGDVRVLYCAETG